MRELFLDDYAQKLTIGRMATALGYGLDPTPFRHPLPRVVIAPPSDPPAAPAPSTPGPPPSASWLARWGPTLAVAAASLLGGGGAGAVAVAAVPVLLKALAASPPAVTGPGPVTPPAADPQAALPAAQEFRVTFSADDEGTQVDVQGPPPAADPHP